MSSSAPGTAPPDTLHIHLIEDNPGDARLIQEHLDESDQATALRWDDALSDGLAPTDAPAPDVALLDLNLPDSTGPETVRRYNEHAPEVPIVVLTGADTLDTALQVLEAGAAEYLRKDELAPRLLIRTLSWATERARLQRQLRRREAWISSITENMAGGVFRCTPEAGIAYANEAFASLLGYDAPGAVEGTSLDTHGATPEARSRLQAFQAGDPPSDPVEIELERQDGTTFVALLRGTSVEADVYDQTYQDGVITDITERVETEQALRRSRKRLAEAQQIANLGSWERNFETDTLHWSAETRRIFGWSPDEPVTVERFMASVHPDDRTALRKQQNLLFEEGTPIDIKYRIRRPDGETRIIHERGEAEFDEDGTLLRTAGTVYDITEQQRRQEKLRRSRERLRVAQRIAGLGSWERNLRTQTEHWSDEMYRIFGWDRDEPITYETFMAAVHPDDRDALRQQQERALTEQAPIDLDYRIERPDGEIRTLHEQGEVEVDEEGIPIRMSGTVMDITERTERERRLRVLSEAVEQASDAILITEAAPLDDPGPRIVYANAAFETITGYSEAEVLDRTPRLLQGPETERAVLDDLRAHLEAGMPWEGRTINYRKDGTPFILEWTVSPVRDEASEIEYWVAVQRDVTDAKEKEDELRRQRNLLDQTQKIAGAWEATPDSNELSWSEEVYRIHEVPPDTPIAFEDYLDFYTPESRAHFEAVVEDCIEHQEAFDEEFAIRTAEGNRRWVRVVGAPSEVREGEVRKLAGAVQDVTERMRAQDALVEREARLRGLANSIPGAIYQLYVDEEGEVGFHFISTHVEAVLGLSAETEAFYERFVEHVPPSHREALRTSVREAAEDGTDWRMEFPFDRPDGERIWLLGASTPERQDEQLVFNGVILDITDRKAAERELRDERDRLATLFNSLPVSVVQGVPDADRFLVSRVNDAFESTFGVAAETIEGNDLHNFIVPPEHQERAASINQKVLDQPALRTEVRRQAEDGTRVFQVQAAVRGADTDSPEAYAIYTDVTERKRREEELLEAKKEAEEASRLKTAMLANMSHEVRTPLTSIIGFAETLKDDLSPPYERHAALIYESAQQLMKILDSALQLSRLEAGMFELEREPVDLNRVVGGAVERFRPQAVEASVTLHHNGTPSLSEVMLNERALTQITENLLENAIKFTPEGGSVWVRTECTEQAVVVAVEDTGVGIDEDTVPQIFESFTQESGGVRRQYGGVGLGLSIVKQLTDALDGSIEVDTEKGEGTCFTVRFPQE